MRETLVNWKSLLLGLAAFVVVPQTAHAWGERGHHLICTVAARLVPDPELREFLIERGHLLGHLCNIPDISWRSLPPALTSLGNPTHHFEPDVVGMQISDFGPSYADFHAKVSVRPHAHEKRKIRVHDDIGSLPWRVDQFFRLSREAALKIPRDKKHAVSVTNPHKPTPYDQAVIAWLVPLAVAGHYIGDASMPYHTTHDYDGWLSGRGGIHGFYETRSVNWFELDLEFQVERLARRNPHESLGGGVVTTMLRFMNQTHGELAHLNSLDEILKPSEATFDAVHAVTKVREAERPPVSKAAPRFHGLILHELARSAKLLAEFWNALYFEAGRPL